MRINLQTSLCKKFCPYYKPTKNEDLACQGFHVVEGLLRKDRKIPFHKIYRELKAETEKELISVLCADCLFYENDCDFVDNPPLPPLSKNGKKGVRDEKKHPPPCGGFILLGHLLEKNIISIDDIRNII